VHKPQASILTSASRTEHVLNYQEYVKCWYVLVYVMKTLNALVKQD